MTSQEAFIAINRFGVGPRVGEMEKISSDPKAWLHGQLNVRPSYPVFESLGSSQELAKMLIDLKESGDGKKLSPMQRKALRKKEQNIFMKEMEARFNGAVATQTPLLERLVWFWSNHFTVSARAKKAINIIAGAYEREAIRPHILGKFSDMLLAVVRHPAMLVYLDNATSIGPNSVAGKNRDRGLNENLAREIMELHTLGVGGGYTQDDVISLAKIITGWSVDKKEGRFHFAPAMHEPSGQILLGKTYAQTGEDQGVAVLTDLARHPSTARFVATKLARHFIADDPPETAIKKLETTFLKTDGDLKSLVLALIDMPEVWADPLPKVKTPYEMAVSGVRLLQMQQKIPFQKIFESLTLLDHRPFGALSPAGWPDKAEDWMSPSAIINRVEWCHVLAQRTQINDNPVRLSQEVIGPVAHAGTIMWIERAPSPADGLGLLLASAEFQRR